MAHYQPTIISLLLASIVSDATGQYTARKTVQQCSETSI